ALSKSTNVMDPIVLLVEAETALRRGDYARAQALGEKSGHMLGEGDDAARAFLIATRAAHLREDSDAVNRNAAAAKQATDTIASRKEALGLELWSAVERGGTDD